MSDLVRTVDEGAAVDWLRRAVATPSVTGDELAFARLVADELESCGADEVHLEEVAPGRPIVWSVTRGSGGGPSLLLSGHLDTVRVDGWRERWEGTEREDPFGAAVVDGAIWGRGAGDLKAGIATALGALRTLNRNDVRLGGDVVTAWVCDEESGEPGLGRSIGMHGVSRLHGADEPRGVHRADRIPDRRSDARGSQRLLRPSRGGRRRAARGAPRPRRALRARRRARDASGSPTRGPARAARH